MGLIQSAIWKYVIFLVFTAIDFVILNCYLNPARILVKSAKIITQKKPKILLKGKSLSWIKTNLILLSALVEKI